jgi:hypothetical protein
VTELWSAEQAAAYWGVSESRARAVLASRKIKRVSGYPAAEVIAVTLRQGARTDLSRNCDPDGNTTGHQTRKDPDPHSNHSPPEATRR